MSHIYPGAHTLTPYIVIRHCIRAIEFYKKAFGAVEGGRVTMPDGTIAHAELMIEGSLLMLSEENKNWGNTSPTTLDGTTCTLGIYVTDADTVFKQAIEAGATEIMPVADTFYGDRAGVLMDPFGHKWSISTHTVDVGFEELQKRCDAMFAEQK